MVRWLLIFIGLWVFETQAQDIHFSQWEAAEMNFNPAQAGDFEGDWQFSSIYRNQWKSIAKPFTTFSASYTSKLYFLPAGWSVSGMVLSDRSGSIVDMKNDQVHLGVNKAFVAGDNRFHLGLQGAYTIRGIDWSQASHPDQFNQEIGLFDHSLPTGESNFNNQLTYADLHFGALWNRRVNDWVYEAGFALYHLTSPPDSYFGNELKLPIRHTYQASARRYLSNANYVQLEIRDMHHARASETNYNATYGMMLNSGEDGVKEVFGNLMHRNGFGRNGDALMLGVGAATRTVRFMIAYDINVSELDVATGNRGGVEVGLIYTSPSSFSNNITIPCDRY